MQILSHISKQFNDGLTVLNQISLSVQAHNINCLLGPSGCGKSTLLRVAAGLLAPDSGTVHLVPKQCAMVFQEPRLLPWLTVAENLALALNPMSGKAQNTVISEVLTLMHLKGINHYMPSELSGGMAQRVSIARALLQKPEILLMDEPFAALDAITRADLQTLLLNLIRDEHMTCLFVTHDIDEALLLGARICMMRQGRITEILEDSLHDRQTRIPQLKNRILNQLIIKDAL